MCVKLWTPPVCSHMAFMFIALFDEAAVKVQWMDHQAERSLSCEWTAQTVAAVCSEAESKALPGRVELQQQHAVI